MDRPRGKRTMIRLKRDTLDEENARLEQAPLAQPLFLNSVPKSGSHLLRNVLRMFVPVAQQYNAQFIQWANLAEHREAFDPARPMLSWGHLLFSDASAVEAAAARKLILVRDPYTWVLARARFFVSEQFGDGDVLAKNSRLSPGALLNLMIFGIKGKALGLRELYDYNALAWLDGEATLVRYEELAAATADLESDAAEGYFGHLLDAAGLERPGDWRERVRIGADRKQSGTASENLTGAAVAVPGELTEAQKALVDHAAPGLRALLGYA